MTDAQRIALRERITRFTNLSELREHITAILPLLESNLRSLQESSRDEQPTRTGIPFVEYRLNNSAKRTLNVDMPVEDAFCAASALVIDLRAAAGRMNNQEVEAQLEDWLEYYREAGFSRLSPHMNIPYPDGWNIG